MEGFHPNRSCKHEMSKFTITVTGVILCLWFAQCRFKKKKRERATERERSTGSDSRDITIAGSTGHDRMAQTSYR